MSLKEYVDRLCAASGEWDAARTALRETEGKYTNRLSDLCIAVWGEFVIYLNNNPQLPKESFIVGFRNTQNGFLTWGPTFVPEQTKPYAISDLEVVIMFGLPGDAGVRDVTQYFQPFVAAQRHVDVKVVRRFGGEGRSHDEFYKQAAPKS